MSLTHEIRASCCWHTKTAYLRHFCSLCHCISACLDFRRMHFLSVTINRCVFVFLLFHQHVTRKNMLDELVYDGATNFMCTKKPQTVYLSFTCASVIAKCVLIFKFRSWFKIAIYDLVLRLQTCLCMHLH